MTVPVFKKEDGTFTRSFTEAPSGCDVWYVEVPGFDPPTNITIDQLIQLRPLGCWKRFQFGLREPYVNGERVKVLRSSSEVE